MMPRNRSTSDSRKPILQDTDCYEINMDNYQEISLTSLKHIFQLRAFDAWNIQKNEKLAIFYQTVSFCLKCMNYRDCENEEVRRYLEQINKEMNYQMNESNNENHTHFSHFDNVNKYLEREIASTCRNQFPKEWTVIQLSKHYNPYALSSKFEDIVTYNTGLSMTIFKHSAVKDMLMVDVKKSTCLDNIYEKVFKLNRMISENAQPKILASGQSMTEKDARDKYLKISQDIEVFVQDIINNLTSFLGPWICALSGNFKNRKSIEIENEIRKVVMEFLSTRNYLTDYQQKLIHLVARRTDLLSHQQIFVAITYILQDKSNLGYSDIDLNDLYDHLTWIKQEFKYEDISTHPCILIVDELLDQLPFEMVNTQQEFTRICSFTNLKRLWESHNTSMDNSGNVLAPIINCQGYVNPDASLIPMEERMRKFFNYWLPSWKVFYRNKPDSFNETLSQCDVLVYCGHGSGTHCLTDNVYNLKSKAIVFLFGCGSTSLSSNGLNSEMTGAHNYYHLGNSPAVVGFLWTVSDFPTDLCSTRLLSSWIPSNTKPHWQTIDKNQWKKQYQLNFTRVCEIITSPSLPEVVTRMRTDIDLPIALRASLVYRGLPVVANYNPIPQTRN